MTQLERRILGFITTYIARNGTGPTLREIGEGLGIKSRGTIHRYVESLRRQKYIRRKGRGWRDIQLTRKNLQSLTVLPLEGSIAGGKSIEVPDEYTEINFSELLLGPDRYVLKVKGPSMEGAGILSGDYIIVRKAGSARNDDIVVALIDNQEITLKRLRKHGDRIELMPDNPSLTSMIYPTSRVHIQGVVVGQVRIY